MLLERLETRDAMALPLEVHPCKARAKPGELIFRVGGCAQQYASEAVHPERRDGREREELFPPVDAIASMGPPIGIGGNMAGPRGAAPCDARAAPRPRW
jgi:hypothetical protein